MPNLDSTLCVVDETVLTTLLQSIRPMTYSFARSSGIDADDLYQDIAIRIVRKWPLIMQVEFQRSYVRRLAHNAMISAYRKVARRRQIAPTQSMHALEEQGGAVLTFFSHEHQWQNTTASNYRSCTLYPVVQRLVGVQWKAVRPGRKKKQTLDELERETVNITYPADYIDTRKMYTDLRNYWR